MDINILDKLGEEYDFVRQKFYSIMKNKMALNEKEEIPFNESTFDKLKKSKEDIYKETLVTSWDFGLNQQFKNADKTVVVYDKMQTNDKKEMDKIPMLNYQKGDPCVYHLCYCDELRKLTQKETRSIWVFARPIDGYLTIVEEDENKHRVTMSTNKIEVCPTCFNALRLKEIGYRQEEFDIKRFLYEYPSNCSIKMPKIDISVDSADQASVEMSIRRKKILLRAHRYTCNRCKTQFKEDSHLEIYHKNKDQSDNRLDNLEVLCQTCYQDECVIPSK